MGIKAERLRQRFFRISSRVLGLFSSIPERTISSLILSISNLLLSIISLFIFFESSGTQKLGGGWRARTSKGLRPLVFKTSALPFCQPSINIDRSEERRVGKECRSR